MNTHQTLRQTLLALSCAAWLFSAVAHAKQSTLAPGDGGTSIRDILGLPPAGGGGGESMGSRRISGVRLTPLIADFTEDGQKVTGT